MANTFEDKFSECLSDMISICYEYVGGQADRIFVYSYEQNHEAYTDCFFQIGSGLAFKHRINDLLGQGQRKLDTSPSMQRQLNNVLRNDRAQIRKLCKEFQREVPVELRLVYEVKTGRFHTRVSYDPVPDEIDSYDIRGEWMREEAARLGLTPAE